MTNLNPRRVVLGIDFGATNLKALIIDKEGEIYQRFLESSEPERGPDATLNQIIELAERARKDADSLGLDLTDIGIGACGLINHNEGELVESPVLPGWRNVPLEKVIREATGLPVYLDNDANLAILGEWWQGSGNGCKVVAGLTLGTGIGGGFVINGHSYRGGWGFGAEFGHISVSEEPSCPCGGKGCLGRVASATATLLRYQKLAGEKATFVKGIFELGRLAESGDTTAKEAIAASAYYLAKATLVLINSLNPHIFIFAGGMAGLGDLLLNPIREFIRASTFKMVGGRTPIVAGTLGIYSGCFGSAWLALSGTPVLP